jgi:hypothetical protein
LAEAEVALGRINYLFWLWRVITWDTLIPALVMLVPVAIETLFPRPDTPLLIAAAAIPPIALFFRMIAGGRQINLNYCSARVRLLQGIALGLGLMPILVLESMFIIFRRPVPRAGPLLAAFFGFYFMATIIAMYPGRTPSTEAAGLSPNYEDDPVAGNED